LAARRLRSWYTAQLCTFLTFEFEKRSQLFVRSHDETLPIIAVCVNNPDCLTFKIQS
jgi:hypothetical protein